MFPGIGSVVFTVTPAEKKMPYIRKDALKWRYITTAPGRSKPSLLFIPPFFQVNDEERKKISHN